MENTKQYTYDLDKANELPIRVYRQWMKALHGSSLKDYVVQSDRRADSLDIYAFMRGQGDNPFGFTYHILLTRNGIECGFTDFGERHTSATPAAIIESIKEHWVMIYKTLNKMEEDI